MGSWLRFECRDEHGVAYVRVWGDITEEARFDEIGTVQAQMVLDLGAPARLQSVRRAPDLRRARGDAPGVPPAAEGRVHSPSASDASGPARIFRADGRQR